MEEHKRTFIRRAFIIPISAAIVVAGSTCALGLDMGSQVEAHQERAEKQADTHAGPIRAAEVTVEDKRAALAAERECYEDPTGREPSEAIVKPDGTTEVLVVSVDEAWKGAERGTHWILNWCN